MIRLTLETNAGKLREPPPAAGPGKRRAGNTIAPPDGDRQAG